MIFLFFILFCNCFVNPPPPFLFFLFFLKIHISAYYNFRVKTKCCLEVAQVIELANTLSNVSRTASSLAIANISHFVTEA